ncbi:putative hydroxypyruvate isomerase [Bacillus rossius redtenbacheri]|uniref:putative hydroxypyruvate isomerase n=1 Tax=Bacillus rossius redtenbacheri TaxID=93214 RepID=UPI002FDEF940
MSLKLKFCANLSFMFQETNTLLERYMVAKEVGFKAVECAFPYDFSADAVKTAKETAGVEQILINVFVGDVRKKELGFAAIPGQEEKFKDSLHMAIKYAKALNCRRVHVMAGYVPEVSEEHNKVYEKNIRYAAAQFEATNIIGLIEPINSYSVPNYFLNSYDRGVEVVKKINSPNLKLMLDLFHLQFMKGNLTNNIRDLLPIVGHIQAAQVPNRNEPDTSGEIDYRYVFSLLEELGYDGWIGLEYKPLTTTKEGLKWINNFGISL